MIHALLTVAFNDVAAQETDGFVSDLAFAGALFDGLEVGYGVTGAASSVLFFVMVRING